MSGIREFIKDLLSEFVSFNPEECIHFEFKVLKGVFIVNVCREENKFVRTYKDRFSVDWGSCKTLKRFLFNIEDILKNSSGVSISYTDMFGKLQKTKLNFGEFRKKFEFLKNAYVEKYNLKLPKPLRKVEATLSLFKEDGSWVDIELEIDFEKKEVRELQAPARGVN